MKAPRGKRFKYEKIVTMLKYPPWIMLVSVIIIKEEFYMKKHTGLILLMLLTVSCSNGEGGGISGGKRMADGYYTAEAAGFDRHGWKEYITIYIANNRIVTVEYNARNASGFLKSWDVDYMRRIGAANNTYPTAFNREYSTALLRLQQTDGIDALTGATDSYNSFKILADTAIARARAGDKSVAIVELPDY
jgi:major membrane immunogen (membrane-anchored lipoprotein)